MQTTFTLNELAEFTKNEKALLASVGLVKDEPIQKPDNDLINSILNYSKSLSVRKSEIMGDCLINLN